jgi:hypothetical protein
VQAYVLAVICLLVGIAGGWFIRGSQSPAAAAETATAPPQLPQWEIRLRKRQLRLRCRKWPTRKPRH